MKKRLTTLASIAALAAIFALAPAPLPAQILEAELTVKGLACPFCAYGLERKLKKLPAAASVAITFKQNLARVHFDGRESPDIGDFFRLVHDAGFKLEELRLLVRGRRAETGGEPCLELPDGKMLPFTSDGVGAALAREVPVGTLVEARAGARAAEEDAGRSRSYILSIESYQVIPR